MSEAYAEDPAEFEDAEEAAEPRGFDLAAAIGKANLAFDLDDSTLAQIGAKVCEEYGIDLDSRKAEGYDERIETALKLAKMTKEARKTYPWDGAANVRYPLVIKAAIEFNARSYAAVVDGPQIVKGKVLGRPDDEKRDRADRIGRHMSYQLLEEMPEWEEETDELLLRLAVVGTLIRKTYFDPVKGRNCSHIIGPDKFVVNYWTKDLATCPRGTHELTFYPNEVLERQRAGLWLQFDLGDAPGGEADEQAPHTFLEQFRLIDLDEDGYPEPYTVTVHKETQKVARIVARFYPEDVEVDQQGRVVRIRPYECYTKYGFIPSPDGSFYDLGFGILLGDISSTVDTGLNQLIDAGTLANLQGGFIGEGVSIKSGALRFKPGEWKKVGTTGSTLRENIVPLPGKGPSAVLFSLLQFLIDAAKELTATQDILTGDTGKSTMPVGTTLALIEQGLKTFTAIVKRIHRALKHELGIIYQLNGRYLEPEVYFNFHDDEKVVSLDDYRLGDVDVVPVSDPNMATDMQKMGRAQFMMGLMGPDMDNTEIKKFAMETAGIPEPQRFLPKGPPAPDPKALEVQAKAMLDERRVDIEEAESKAGIANTLADAQIKQAELALMGPQLQEFAEAVALDTIHRLLGMQNGGAPQVRPEDMGGMAQQPPPGPMEAVPPGPEGPVDGGLGPGGRDVAGGPVPMQPDPGAAGAGMV